MNRLLKILLLTLIILPTVVFAQPTTNTVNDLITVAFTWLSMLVYIVIGIALILFFWGIIKYVVAGSKNEEGRRDGRNLIVYGVIGLFVMVSIWGLVYFLAGVLGVNIGGTPPVPQLLAPTGLTASNSTLVGIIKLIGGWISRIDILLISFALVAFLWGVTKYIASGADEEKRTEARNLIVYGVIGLFAMVAVWGLVYFVGSTLGIDVNNNSVLTVPQIDSSLTIIDKGQNGNPVTITGTAVNQCPVWNPANKDSVSFLAFVCLILSILNPIPPILLGLALLYFFWGIAKYMNSGGNSEELKEGRNTIIYGIIGLFVIVALWGLVFLVKSELGII